MLKLLDKLLLLWANGRCTVVLRANRTDPIFALHASAHGVLAAGKGGRVLYWPGRCEAPLALADATHLALGPLLGAMVDSNGRPLALQPRKKPAAVSPYFQL